MKTLHTILAVFITIGFAPSSGLRGMRALQHKQILIADKQIDKANEIRRAAMLQNGIVKVRITQLDLRKKDLQTRNTCGTCDLFIAYAIDQVLRNNKEINKENVHTQLSALGYGSCIMTCKVNIEAEEFSNTLVNDLKRSKQEADEIVTRIFALGYEGTDGVYPTGTHAWTGQEYYEGLTAPGRLADLSLQLRKGQIPAVHFICNVGASTYGPGAKKVTDYTAHWVLFSVVNHGGTITIWYIDSAENNPMRYQSTAPAYLSYITEHMGLAIQ